MKKRGQIELSVYTVFSIAIGAFLFLFFINVGLRFGTFDGMEKEYTIKDTSLLLTAMHSLQGNAMVDMHYPVHDQEIKYNSTRVVISNYLSDVAGGIYSYRTAGRPNQSQQILEGPDYFEISSYSGKVNINQEGGLDLLSCPKDFSSSVDIDDVALLHMDEGNERDFTENIANTLGRFLGTPDRLKRSFYDEFLHVNLTLAFAEEGNGDNFYAYVNHGDDRAREIACNMINNIAAESRLDVDDFKVYSIDPHFTKMRGKEIPDDMILLELGSIDQGIDSSAVTLSRRIEEVLRSYE